MNTKTFLINNYNEWNFGHLVLTASSDTFNSVFIFIFLFNPNLPLPLCWSFIPPFIDYLLRIQWVTHNIRNLGNGSPPISNGWQHTEVSVTTKINSARKKLQSLHVSIMSPAWISHLGHTCGPAYLCLFKIAIRENVSVTGQSNARIHRAFPVSQILSLTFFFPRTEIEETWLNHCQEYD